jgi:alpha-amylase
MSQRNIVLYLHLHQPFRVRNYSIFDTANSHDYFDASSYDDGANNERIFKKVADKSYRPTNQMLKKLLDSHPEFSFSISITGTFMEQAQMWAPDVIDSFKELVATGRVEIVAETYHHSLAFFGSQNEFEKQVAMHQDKIKQVFGVTSTAFRNTELAYNDELGKWADKAGYKVVLAEGWDPILGWRSPNYVYKPVQTDNVKLLLKNYHLSDDIAFRFSNRGWPEWPLTAEKFDLWVKAASEKGPLINLFMDYETFGEHQWHDTGIFSFFEEFVGKWVSGSDNGFYKVTEAADAYEPADEISMPETVTWADSERDLTAWLGNSMQQEAMNYIYSLEQDILLSNDEGLIADWRKLQTSDHMYYMCTKWFTDGDVHAYFSPYDSPYDAFLYYVNAIRDIRFRLHDSHHTGGLNG